MKTLVTFVVFGTFSHCEPLQTKVEDLERTVVGVPVLVLEEDVVVIMVVMVHTWLEHTSVVKVIVLGMVTAVEITFLSVNGHHVVYLVITPLIVVTHVERTAV